MNYEDEDGFAEETHFGVAGYELITQVREALSWAADIYLEAQEPEIAKALTSALYVLMMNVDWQRVYFFASYDDGDNPKA